MKNEFYADFYIEKNTLGMDVKLWRILRRETDEIVADSIRYSDVACWIANHLPEMYETKEETS